MKKFLPNVSPLTFSGSAIIVGYLLIDDFSATQQEAISSWLGLVSDVLSANAAWLAVIEERPKNLLKHLKKNLMILLMIKKMMIKIIKNQKMNLN